MPESRYRLGIAHLVRVAGTLILALGVLWLVVTLLDLGGPARVTLALLTVAALVVLAVAFARPPLVLRLDDAGYHVRWIRGAGRSRAQWSEVDTVVNRDAAGTSFMVFELTDGTSTTVPLTLLGVDQLKAQQDVRERLNAAHGYRRIDRP